MIPFITKTLYGGTFERGLWTWGTGLHGAIYGAASAQQIDSNNWIGHCNLQSVTKLFYVPVNKFAVDCTLHWIVICHFKLYLHWHSRLHFMNKTSKGAGYVGWWFWKSRFSLPDVQSDVLSPSPVQVTAFSIDQLHREKHVTLRVISVAAIQKETSCARGDTICPRPYPPPWAPNA